VVIDHPDLSIDGDGSWVGSLEEVLALWKNASSGSGLMAEVPHEEAS
jgi:hypothetical protein